MVSTFRRAPKQKMKSRSRNKITNIASSDGLPAWAVVVGGVEVVAAEVGLHIRRGKAYSYRCDISGLEGNRTRGTT